MLPVPPRPVPEGFKPSTFGKNQPEYEQLPALTDGKSVVTQWLLTSGEIADLMLGGRLQLTLLTFGQDLQPVKLEIVKR